MGRIFLFPGFGEDAYCFDELLPYLQKSHELFPVDYRPVLDKFTFPLISRMQFCHAIIRYYGIKKQDKIIGHSMGGYLAFQIREIIYNDICLVGSFCDPQKIIQFFPQSPRLSQLVAGSGLIKTDFLRNFLLSKIQDERIKTVQEKVMRNMKSFSNTQLALMLEVSYESKIISEQVNPLRIHAKTDKVVLPPDESYIEVDGGHFCMNLYPEQVASAMKENDFIS